MLPVPASVREEDRKAQEAADKVKSEVEAARKAARLEWPSLRGRSWPQRATTGASGCIGRREAALGARERRHSASDPSDSLWPWSQAVPESPSSPPASDHAGAALVAKGVDLAQVPDDELQPNAEATPVTSAILYYARSLQSWRARGQGARADATETLHASILAWRATEAVRAGMAAGLKWRPPSLTTAS